MFVCLMRAFHLKVKGRLSHDGGPKNPCRQVSFELAEKAALLHLPADKPFLAEMAGLEFSPSSLSSYRRYARKTIYPSSFKSVVEFPRWAPSFCCQHLN